MEQKEFQRRCEEVFDTQEDEEYYSIDITPEGEVVINMSEINETGQFIIFDYIPDMTNRPEALDYLLGARNDFND